MTFAFVISGAALLLAQNGHKDLFTGPPEVKWMPAPPALPAGAQLAVMYGDPSKNGPFVVRVKMPAGYRVAAHHHPTVENVTILEGSFHTGMGDKLEEKNGTSFAPGGFVSMPANMNHYAWTTAETIIQVHGDGPLQITYVNPADDPSNK
jgi:quercetin dioxygenase-like cupin family protein